MARPRGPSKYGPEIVKSSCAEIAVGKSMRKICRGRHADEASAIHDQIWGVSEGALTDADSEVIWLVFGNPTRNTGRFRECFGKHGTAGHAPRSTAAT